MVISTIWPPPTSHPASSWTSPLRLIPFVTMDVGHQPDELSPVPSPTFTTSRSPYAGGFFAAAISRFFTASMAFVGSRTTRLPLVPFPGQNIDAARFTLMLRAVVLPPFLGDTSLQHLRSPRSTGCLLRGHLSVTTAGLSPVSR